MMQLDRLTLGIMAKELGFVRDPMALWKCRNKAEDKMPLDKGKVR